MSCLRSELNQGGADEVGAVFERGEKKLRTNHDGGDTTGIYQRIMELYQRGLRGAILVLPAAILAAAIARFIGYISSEEFLIAALVVITLYYAIQASRTVAETQKARRTEILPRLKLTIVPSGPNHILMRIVNIGKGAAMDVEVTHRLEGLENAERSWKVPLLMPGEYKEFPIPTGKDSYETTMDFFTKESRKLGMEAGYSDILGLERKIKDEINVKEMIMLLQMQGELEGIKKLKKIKRSR